MMRRTVVIFLGVTLGIGLGLAAGWGFPIRTVKTTPAALSADWQSDWVLMTAQAYSLDLDLDQARQRLGLLGSDDPGARVAQCGERAIAEGLPPNYIKVLAQLADALGARTPTLSSFLAK
jgi:hypothetical protein